MARSYIAVFFHLNRGAKAACSVRESPSDWRNESDLSDFHVLRRGFIPRRIPLSKSAICARVQYRRMDSYFLTTETPSHGEENKEKTPCSLHLPDLPSKSRAVPGLSPLGDRGSVVKTVGKPTKLSTPSYKSWQVQVKKY